jgi:hypothetical protein
MGMKNTTNKAPNHMLGENLQQTGLGLFKYKPKKPKTL